MHICDDPWVFKVNKSIVDKEMTSGQRMEDVEISIFDPRAIEVQGGEGSSVERSGVFMVTLASHSYKMSVFPNAPITDVLSCFCLSLFIKEDDGVEVGLSSIIPYPPITRMVRILEITSEGGGRCEWTWREMST